MSRKNLDVFLSSDLQEFEKERNKLSKIISNIPYLTCTPLENRGADSRDILDASLKAVKNSDIYLGVFGHNYSEITIKEYREAVKRRKPCLTYVKKDVQRHKKLTKFIEEELKNQFKYYPFKGEKDLYKQAENDLKRFIFETLEDGLEARKQKKEEVQRLIVEERQAAQTRPITEEPLAEADSAFRQGNYIECLVRTTIALELVLKEELRKRNVNAERTTLGVLLNLAAKHEVIGSSEANKIREVSYVRNVAVHTGDIPSRDVIARILENTRRILNRLNLSK
jgi:hypothetical protein